MSKVREMTLPDGRVAKLHAVEFETEQEGWNEYTLSNGMKVRAKNVVTRISLLLDDDGNPILDPNGDPQVFVDGNVNLVVSEYHVDATNPHEQTRAFLAFDDAAGLKHWYAYNFRADAYVEIDPAQAWFWTPEWQAHEREADEDIAAGRYDDFEDFIDSLG